MIAWMKIDGGDAEPREIHRVECILRPFDETRVQMRLSSQDRDAEVDATILSVSGSIAEVEDLVAKLTTMITNAKMSDAVRKALRESRTYQGDR